MRLATKIAYNTIIQAVSKIIATILGLVAVFMMTRYLGKAGFGEYTTIITFLSFFGIMADLGLTLITVKMISHPGVDEKKVLNNLFTLRFFSALLFLGCAPLVAIFFPYTEAVKVGIGLTTLSFLFIALNQILVGIFQKRLRMDKVSIAEIVSRIVLVFGVFLAVRYDAGLLGVMWAIIIGSAVNFFVLLLLSLKFIRLKFAFDFSLWREIITQTWPMALTIIFNLLYLKTDTLILSIIKSSGEVGVYGAAYKVIEVLTMLPFMFAGVILPILTADWASKNKERFDKVLQRSFDLMIILVIPMIVGIQFLAKPIIVLVAGQEFSASGTILKILIFAAGLVFVSCLLSHAIVAIGQQRKIIGAYFFTAITSVVGYLIFIPKFSYFGAAAVTIYSEATITVFMLFYIVKLANFWPKLGVFFKSLLASVIMGAGLWFLPKDFFGTWWGLSLVIVGAGLLYFIALYILKGISRKDLLDLLNKEIE